MAGIKKVTQTLEGYIQMNYKEEVTKAMTILGRDEKTIFLGQSIRYPGHVMFNTLVDVPMEKRIELPVMEDAQMGMSIGLALEGFIPITIYPRMDFLILALNQLVNHLDKIEEMSAGQYKPRVIIRTMVGSKKPMNPGPQHCQDHTEALKLLTPSIKVIKLLYPSCVIPFYKKALEREKSTVIIEMGDLYA